MMKTPFLNSVACGTRRAGRWLRRGPALAFSCPLVVTGLADGAVRYPGRFLAVAGRAAPVVPETAQGLRSPESPFCGVPYGNYSRPADSAV